MIEENKISLFGDAVAHGRVSKIKGYFRRPDVNVALLSSVFLATQIELLSPGAGRGTTLASLGLFIGVNLLSMEGVRCGEKALFALCLAEGTALDKKCINTKPSDVEKASYQKWGPIAQRAKTMYAGYALSSLLLLAAQVLTEPSGPTVPSLGTAVAVGAPFWARALTGVYRWHKVAKPEWAVEDRGPPPERVKQKAKVPGFLKLAPQVQ